MKESKASRDRINLLLAVEAECRDRPVRVNQLLVYDLLGVFHQFLCE